MNLFSDPMSVAQYVETAPRNVPGYFDLHRMALTLLSENAPEHANILVIAAGGGLELRSFSEARPNWSFVGVDPSQPMLDLASHVLGPLVERVELVNGYAEDAPARQFDGATCFLAMHFLPVTERIRVLRAQKDRLAPGAPLVIAHHCDPGVGPVEDWLARSAAFSAGPQHDVSAAKASASNMAQRLTLLTQEEEEALLRDAGFTYPAMFYAALSFRGWVAYAEKG